MKTEAHTDQGTVLRADQAALVFDMDGRMSLILPNVPEDMQLPASCRLMLAIAGRCDDPDWVAEMIEEGDRLMSGDDDGRRHRRHDHHQQYRSGS